MQLPAPGQLVTVRQRQFVVSAISASEMALDATLPVSENRCHHLVTLSSVDDEGLGDSLQVIWELEPGTRVYERSELPNPHLGFDPPARLDAFLDAVRWGAVASAERLSLHAPFRSGIEIEDYQLDPVVRALDMPRANLLIADDVGLGKTIEAGLVIQELMLRNRVRNVLVLCPASLQIQWRDQMRDKFGLEFRIVDRQLMKDLRRRRGIHVNPWSHFPRLITSIDFLKRESVRRLFQELLPPGGKPSFPRLFDLLIIDEAHNVAPSGKGRYTVDSQRTQTVRMLAPHFEHKLFLSATPHNGYTESFSALLELLDDQRFHRSVTPDSKQLAAVMVRRLKSELPPKLVDGREQPRFATRHIQTLKVNYTEEERDIHRTLYQYTQQRVKHAKDATERFASEFVLKLLKKRLFSSPAAFLSTLEAHKESIYTATKADRTTPKPKTPSLQILQRHAQQLDDSYADADDSFDIYDDYQDHEEYAHDVVDEASRLFRDLSDQESQQLERMLDYARRATEQHDAKAEALLQWLKAHCFTDNQWNHNRVIIFTEYRATQKWLLDVLATGGLADASRIAMLHGALNKDEREDIKAAFQTSPAEAEVRILLATDAASEGIDLQNHCSHLIHYEIPWNPNRLEQRNGRIDRHGQRAKEVQIYHFVGAGFDSSTRTLHVSRKPGELEDDLEFLIRVVKKVDTIRQDLGKVGPVIADQIEQVMLRNGPGDLSLEKERKPSEAARDMLRLERDIRGQLDRLFARLTSSQAHLRISPDNVRAVVTEGLALAGQPPLQPVTVKLPAYGDTPARSIDAFHIPQMKGSWARCIDGLAHPYTGVLRPVVFDHELARGTDKVVLAHLNHALVQLCLHYLRAEIWATAETQQLRRVTVRTVPQDTLPHTAAIGHARLMVLDRNNHRLHEELITAGVTLVDNKINRLGVNELISLLDAASTPTHVSPQDVLADWDRLQPSLQTALDARVKDRVSSLQTRLDEKAQKEKDNLTTLLNELKRQIEESLVEQIQIQTEMFATPDQEERDNIERNRLALEQRAASIPDEIKREVHNIEERYRDPASRMFPIALTFLIPQSKSEVA
jgi:ERCC4-related helicase